MRALFLSTYPVSGEQSGGVVRLGALCAALEAAGHEPHVLALVGVRHDPPDDVGDEPLVPLDEHAEGVGLAREGAADELVVGRRGGVGHARAPAR